MKCVSCLSTVYTCWQPLNMPHVLYAVNLIKIRLEYDLQGGDRQFMAGTCDVGYN